MLTALRSVTLTNPTTALDEQNKIVYIRPDATKSQVSIVSGGGSGHEPSFAAFVGRGCLTAAVAGTIFASPSAEQIRRCLLNRVDSSKGVLVVVMNYTGDVLNFGMAVEKAKASGIDVEMVVVADDAGVGRKQSGKVGRRGIAGTVLVQKIAGALAAQGENLSTVSRAASMVAKNTVSIGSSLLHVHVPGRVAAEDEELKPDEVEIGMGIHNESGCERTATDLSGTIKLMLKYMLDESDPDRSFISIDKKDEVVLLINNLGGVSPLELGGITTEVVDQLQRLYGIQPVRILSGTFMTSLNGLGFSISISKVTDLGVSTSMLELLDSPAEVAGWTAPIKSTTWRNRPSGGRSSDSANASKTRPAGIQLEPAITQNALASALEYVIQAEPDVTKYDTAVGDGDCGIGLKRGAEAIQKQLSEVCEQQDAALFLDSIIEIVESSMDGTSGALYAIFLNALANGLRAESLAEARPADAKIWSKALAAAMQSLSKYTPAQPGDRTLIDALAPFIEVLQAAQDVQQAANAAQKGADSTKGMKASLGRTVYIGGDDYGDIPDPGAYGLAQFFEGLAVGLKA